MLLTSTSIQTTHVINKY